MRVFVRVFMRPLATRAMRVLVGVFVVMRNPGRMCRRVRGFVVVRMHVIMTRSPVAVGVCMGMRVGVRIICV